MPGPFAFEQATADPDVAESLMRKESGDWNFSVERPGATGRPFQFTVRQLLDDEVTIARNSASGRFSTYGTTEMFSVTTVEGGRFAWESEGVRGLANDAPILLRPEHPMLCRVDGMELTNVYVPHPVLEETARRLYGTDDVHLRFSSLQPLDAAHAAYFTSLVAYANAAVDTGAFQHELVRSALVRNLAVGMLQTFPLVGDRALRTMSAALRGRLFRSAVDFLRGHASLPITADDAAHSVGCSLAELDQIFRAHAMMSTAEYLATLRLTAAHEDLLVAEPGSDGVTAVAHRWGFASVDAFDRRYRRAYGRSPADTLLS